MCVAITLTPRGKRETQPQCRQRCCSFLMGFPCYIASRSPCWLLLCVSQFLSRSQSVGHCCHAVAPVRLSARSPLLFLLFSSMLPSFSWPRPVSAYTAHSHTHTESCRWLRNLSRVCCLVTVNELTMWRIRNAHVTAHFLLGVMQLADRQTDGDRNK